MSELYDAVHKSIRTACIAAFVVDPLNPSLSVAELRDVVVQDGHAGPLFDEAWPLSMHGRQAQGSRRTQIQSIDLIALNAHEQVPPQIPQAEAISVIKSFDGLNRQQGINSSKTIEMLAGTGLSTDGVRRGLGLLLLLGLAQRSGDGFVCQASTLDGYMSGRIVRSPSLDVMIGRVRSVFAARDGVAVATTPPIERFHLFLKKQGLNALAEWWAMTVQEVRSLGERHPTAATVLAASLLEAALVAIAAPARKADAWKRDFLDKPSKDWKLGALIDQAEIPQPEIPATFGKNDAVLARTLADLRNRIHVGKFAVDGPDRFKPQFADAQDATIALKHLEMLLARILDWAPISALG